MPECTRPSREGEGSEPGEFRPISRRRPVGPKNFLERFQEKREHFSVDKSVKK